jgi:hypothetical protein
MTSCRDLSCMINNERAPRLPIDFYSQIIEDYHHQSYENKQFTIRDPRCCDEPC